MLNKWLIESKTAYLKRSTANTWFTIPVGKTPGFTRWLFNRHLFQSMLGVPFSQQNLVRNAYNDGMAAYIRQCFRRVFFERSLRDNYFWKLYVSGSYSEECCPNYLQVEFFDQLKNRVDRLRTHTATLSEFLQNNPGSYTHFVLLDHQDWLAAHNTQALQEEWRLILANSSPGTKILLRSAAAKVDFIPSFVRQKVTFNPADTAHTHAPDRVGTYASVLLAEVN